MGFAIVSPMIATTSIKTSPSAETTQRRPRGRPRKTLEELDDGNRRRLLIDNAAKLFRRKGFDAVSTRDIAAAAGMQSGSPFYHFESKVALLSAVMHEGMQQALARQTKVLQALAQEPKPVTPERTLRELIRNHLEVLLGSGSDFVPVMLYEWRSLAATQQAEIAQLTNQYEAQWMPVLEALAAQGALQGNPRMARLLIFGALNWTVQWYDDGKTVKNKLDLNALTEQAMALFIRS